MPEVAPAPVSASEFQLAALKAITEKEGPEAVAPPAEGEKPAAAPAAEGEKPAEAPKPPPPAEEPKIKSLEVVAREKAAMRKQTEALAEREKKVAPLLDAVASGSALSVLKAAGFSYNDAVQEILGTKKPTPGAAKKAPDESDPILNEVKELRAELQREKAEAQRVKVQALNEKLVKDNEAKFPLTAARGEGHLAMAYVEQYWKDTGELPAPGDIGQSLMLALEAVEAHLAKEAAVWDGVLQKKKAAVTNATAPKDAGVQAASVQATQSKTLNSSQTGPTRSADPDEPRTPEDYQRRALAAIAGS